MGLFFNLPNYSNKLVLLTKMCWDRNPGIEFHIGDLDNMQQFLKIHNSHGA